MRIFGFEIKRQKAEQPTGLREFTLDDLPTASGDGFLQGLVNYNLNDGEKFAGGFGATSVFLTDYWTLRARSRQLFTENLYARGLIRRLVTNEINVGLQLEAMPDEETLGYKLGDLAIWSEDVENRFIIWGANPQLCDHQGRRTFGMIQEETRRTALVEGDVLIIQRIDPHTLQPTIQMVPGGRVCNPIGQSAPKPIGQNVVRHGVEMDDRGRHVAFFVQGSDGGWTRIPAYGPRSGRRVAWLVYGSDHLHDDVRGQPLLSLVLQSLKEIDRYRDSAQRKAVINSVVAMFIKKGSDKPGTRPLTAGAVRRDTAVTDTGDGKQRRYDIASQIPGLVMQELQEGEEPVGFNNAGIDLHFPQFETAVLRSIAWSNELPPEILELSFASNYSASQAALNEFKVYLNKVRERTGSQVCDPVYQEWLIGQVRSRKIEADQLIDALRRPDGYDIVGAWLGAEWCGQIKPATDMLKTVRAYREMIDLGSITYARAAREMTGTKFSRNIQQQLIEANQIAAVRALLTRAEEEAKLVPEPANGDGDGDDDGDDDKEDT